MGPPCPGIVVRAEFLQHARTVDPAGKYLLETRPGAYNGVGVDMFLRLFVSFGCFQKLVLQTAVLEFVAMDGAHLRRVFGGVLLSAIMPTANRQLCCLAFAVVESETEESCCCLWSMCCRSIRGENLFG